MGTGNIVIGVGKQTALGSLPANPTFLHGLEDGGLTVDPSQEPDKLTSASLSPAAVYRGKVEAAGAYGTRAWLKSLGLYLLGILGSCVTTGAGPYQHVITEGGSTPYLALWEKALDAAIVASKDHKVTELELSWDENNPLTMKVATIGGVVSFPVSITPTVDESGTANYFTPVGGTFKYDIDSGTPVVSSILGGSVAIKRDGEGRYFSGSIEAGDVRAGSLEVTVSFKISTDTTATWRTLLTGTSSGSSAATAPVYGSFEVTFTSGTNSLKLEAAKVAFAVAKPEADPDDKAPDVDLSGLCLSNAGASPITATLTNAQASY